MQIDYLLEGQDLIRQDTQKIAEGAIQTLVIHIDFRDKYTKYAKIGRFEGLRGSYDCAFNGDEVIVPWEVLVAPSFNFSLLMINGETGNYVMTSRKVNIKVYDSITIADRDPLPKNTIQYIEQMKQLCEYSKLIANMMLRWANEGRFDGRDAHAIITEIPKGKIAFAIDGDGHLYMYYDEFKPNFELGQDGHLYYIIEE